VDKERVVWTRSSDGAMVATVHGYESGSGATLLSTLNDRVTVSSTDGMTAERRVEAATRGGAPIVTGIARLLLQAIRGGRYTVSAEVKSQGGTDPTISAKILDDLGYSDYVRVTRGTYATRPAASANNQNQFYVATDTKALYYNDDGTRWIQLAGPQEASTITTPSSGFGAHYLNYNTTFRYWKDALGYVHVVGEINDDGTALASVASNAIIWDGFPAGYRPTNRSYFTVEGNSNTPNHILINTSGQLRVSDNATNANRYMNFGHITFPTF
jgi:hypothetical protein